MADQFSNFARSLFAQGEINWLADTFRVALVTSAYSFNPASSQYLSEVPASAIVFTTNPLANKSITSNGACLADNVVIDALTSANPVVSLLLYKDTGTASTSPLILSITSYSNLPATPVGGSFTILWPSTDINAIFRL